MRPERDCNIKHEMFYRKILLRQKIDQLIMKFLAYTFLIFGLMTKTYGLICYNCDINNWNGESTDWTICLNPIAVGASVITTSTCPNDTTTVVNYCLTKMTIRDGVVTTINRRCEASNTDVDDNTAAMPTAPRCVSALQRHHFSDSTECYYSCNVDNCNTKTTTSLKQCSTACGSNGACNYITGECQCKNGYSGSDCTTAPTATRQCVQCTTETDSTCASATTTAPCPKTQQYCSTATTTILQNGVAVGTPITTRACSETLKAVDECSFTNIITDSPISDSPPGYREYTCISTCDTDGCNTNTADGVLDTGTEANLKCFVCSDLTGAGSCNPGSSTMTRTACSSESTHCKSTVEYLISKNLVTTYNEAVDAYQLISVVRECASAAVTSSCTDADVNNVAGLKKVTCTDTCEGDGCNNRWPNRPTCIECSTDTSGNADGYDVCVENPPQAVICDKPYNAYCTTQHIGINKNTGKSAMGYPHRMTRGCHFKDIGTGCSTEKLREIDVNSCNRTCTTDGCNVGSGSEMLFQTVFAILVPTILGWFAQMRF